MHLRDFLIREYEKQGWNVCSDFFESSACLPDGWVGSFPDLVAMKGSRKEAICIENRSNFVGDYIPKKWKSILRNPGISLVIIVRDRESYNLAVQTAKMHNIEMDCRVMRRIAKKGARVTPMYSENKCTFSVSSAGLYWRSLLFS